MPWILTSYERGWGRVLVSSKEVFDSWSKAEERCRNNDKSCIIKNSTVNKYVDIECANLQSGFYRKVVWKAPWPAKVSLFNKEISVNKVNKVNKRYSPTMKFLDRTFSVVLDGFDKKESLGSSIIFDGFMEPLMVSGPAFEFYTSLIEQSELTMDMYEGPNIVGEIVITGV